MCSLTIECVLLLQNVFSYCSPHVTPKPDVPSFAGLLPALSLYDPQCIVRRERERERERDQRQRDQREKARETERERETGRERERERSLFENRMKNSDACIQLRACMLLHHAYTSRLRRACPCTPSALSFPPPVLPYSVRLGLHSVKRGSSLPKCALVSSACPTMVSSTQMSLLCVDSSLREWDYIVSTEAYIVSKEACIVS